MRSKPTLTNRKQDMSELYPFPKMPAYTGDVATAIKILKAVNLDRERFICLAVWDADLELQRSERGEPTHLTQDALLLRTWISDSLGESSTYEDWLEEYHNLPEGEQQPDRSLASRKAWLASMIEQLEKQL